MARKANSSAEVEDMVGAVNKLLDAKGIAPIELNSMSRLAVKYQAMKRQEGAKE